MNKFSVQFYDQKNCINPEQIKGHSYQHNELPLVFQHQVHGNTGRTITEENFQHHQKCLLHDSDYLITNLPRIGIGVLTADCLPIALADEKNGAIGIVHAGWRGTVGKIVINAINQMKQLYGTSISDLQIFFGPCALPCCYEVDEPFICQLPEWAHLALKNNHFNLALCNEFLLKENGVIPEQINKSHCKCTICNNHFCSYRKNPGNKTRQMSIIWLN